MESINPFTDPDFKKKLLEKEGKLDKGSDDYEELETTNDVQKDLKNIISSAPQLPKTAKNLILDASAIAKNDKEKKALEMTASLNEIFSRYNKEYHTDLNIDFSSLSRTLVNVADPKSRHVLELYVSEVFKSLKPILILHLIQKLTIAIDYILEPQRLFSQEMSLQDVWICVDKIMSYVDQLNQMKDEIQIKGSDFELKKIAESNNEKLLDDPESKQVVDDFMKLFRKDAKK